MRLSLYVFVLHSVHTFVSNYPNHRSPFPDLSAMYFPPGIFPTCWILTAAKERCCQGKKYLLEHLPGARIFWGQERDKSISNDNHQQSPNIFKGCKILQFWIIFRQCKVEKTEQKCPEIYLCLSNFTPTWPFEHFRHRRPSQAILQSRSWSWKRFGLEQLTAVQNNIF